MEGNREALYAKFRALGATTDEIREIDSLKSLSPASPESGAVSLWVVRTGRRIDGVPAGISPTAHHLTIAIASYLGLDLFA
jgi:hypothetical protein